MKALALIFLLLMSLFFVGCSVSNQSEVVQPIKGDITELNYKAADKLLLEARLPKESVMIMATVVNIDDIEKSSTLGRLISEQISSYFVHKNMNVIEIKFRDNIYMKRNEGELMLTREIGNIAKNYKASSIIVGTYAIGGSMVYVNLKIIDPSTNLMMSAVNYSIPVNSDIEDMLGSSRKTFK